MAPDVNLDAGRLRLATAFLGIITLVIVCVVLKSAQSVILPLIIAWLLSYILGPAVTFLTSRKVPSGLAVLLILVLLLWVIYLAVIFLHARIVAFVQVYPKYEARLDELVRALAARFEMASGPLAEMDWGTKVYAFLLTVSGSLFSFFSKLLMVMIFLVFMLLGKPFFFYKVRKAFSPGKARQISDIMVSVSRGIGGYLSLQLLVSLATGFCVWLALRVIGVDFAVTWGALAFFLNFIPTVGSIMASVPPILLAIVQFYPSPWRPIFTVVSMLSIQMVIGNLIAPKLMGDRLNLSPVVVLISLVFWGWLWGVVGALLSVPIAAAIRIVCESIEPLRPIGVMMGSGRRYRQEFDHA